MKDADGNEITKTVTIIVSEDGSAITTSDGSDAAVTEYNKKLNYVNGTVNLTFILDSSLLAGTSVVVYESLYHNSVEVASHADITDEGQTVNYPEIHTNVKDSATGDYVGSIWGALINGIRKPLGSTDADKNGIDGSAQQNIVDTVSLNNLSIGKTYTVSGVRMDAENKTELLVNGETVTATAMIEVTEDGRFVLTDGYAENLTVTSVSDGTVSGTIDLVFSFDSSLLKNTAKAIVVFERLNHNGITVTIHEDYDDEDQTVYDVEVHMSAIDDTIGTHTGSDAEKYTITDTVNMAGLIGSEEYTVTGILVDPDASTEDNLVYIIDSNGDYITASVTFTASAEAA